MKSIEVNLSKKDVNVAKRITRQGRESARKIKRANILLLANRNKKTNEIADILGVCPETVGRTKKKYVENGLDYAINERKRPGAPIKVDGRVEAEIITLACSNPPEGRAKWSLRLIAEKIKLEVSHVTVHNTLKKMKLNRGKSNNGVSQRQTQSLF
jgi:transposase